MNYNKLVRDRIPEIIAAQEVAEYLESKEIEELADVLEVLYALCEAQGHSVDELMKVYEKKHAERGGFSKRILLLGKE